MATTSPAFVPGTLTQASLPQRASIAVAHGYTAAVGRLTIRQLCSRRPPFVVVSPTDCVMIQGAVKLLQCTTTPTLTASTGRLSIRVNSLFKHALH